MSRAKSLLYESFWSYVVVAIILLAPSSGLITLAVPDEPYGSAVGLPDSPHIGKRASDDAEHLAFDATFTAYDIHPKLFLLAEVTFAGQNDLQNTSESVAQIRAPPSEANA